jgi:hypothetical protein
MRTIQIGCPDCPDEQEAGFWTYARTTLYYNLGWTDKQREISQAEIEAVQSTGYQKADL